MEASQPEVRVIRTADAADVRDLLERAWGSVWVARKGELLDSSAYPGFVATLGQTPIGLAIVVVRGDEYEVLSLSTRVHSRGVGQALMRRCFADAQALGCRRVWLTTTNDNVRALAFYQRLGMTICALYLGAVTAARELKPSIPLRSEDGVPIEHEIELELILNPPAVRPTG
jgi:ribosomal protein S18 acetylase RimI-like enzyme